MPAPVLSPQPSNINSAAVAVTNLAADGTLDVQYAVRRDFQLCVAPLVKGLPRQNFQIPGLTPGAVHYIRARSRRADGTVEDWSNTLAMVPPGGGVRNMAPAGVMIEPAIVVVPVPVLSWEAASLPGFPPENLGVDGPVAWVAKNAGSDIFAFRAEVGEAPVDTVALLSSNAAPDATVRIFAGPTPNASWGGADRTFDSGVLPFRASTNLPGRPGYHALLRLGQIVAARYIGVFVTSDNFEDQFHLEHAVFGLNRSTKNHSVEKTESVIDLGTIERTRGGNPVRTIGARMRRVDFDISMLTEAQFEAAYADLDWRVGQTEPILCVPNSKAGSFLHDRILYGPLRGGKTVNPASPRYTRGFTIESII